MYVKEDFFFLCWTAIEKKVTCLIANYKFRRSISRKKKQIMYSVVNIETVKAGGDKI